MWTDPIGLRELMERSAGSPRIRIGQVDGPVAIGAGCFDGADLSLAADDPRLCLDETGPACRHGSGIARVLVGTRTDAAPEGLCPACPLSIYPIFSEADDRGAPQATVEELAEAVVRLTVVGARILNLSLALNAASPRDERRLRDALDFAASRNVLIVAATGNTAEIGRGTALLAHPAVIPVAACDIDGQLEPYSNLGASLGRRGLMAPAAFRAKSGVEHRFDVSGTSLATAIVTGALALLWSLRPGMTASALRYHVARAHRRQRTILPPLLDCASLLRDPAA